MQLYSICHSSLQNLVNLFHFSTANVHIQDFYMTFGKLMRDIIFFPKS